MPAAARRTPPPRTDKRRRRTPVHERARGSGTGRGSGRPAPRIHHGTRRVDEHRHRRGAETRTPPDPVDDLGQHERRRANRARRRTPRRDPERRLRPTTFASVAINVPPHADREERHPPARVHDQQPDRRVGAGDERVDHRVVESGRSERRGRRFHERRWKRPARRRTSSPTLTANAMAAARAQIAVRGQGKQDAEGNRDEERQLVRHAAEARPRHAVARRLPGGPDYRRSVSVNLETSVRSNARPRSPVTAARRLISASPALQGAQLPELLDQG